MKTHDTTVAFSESRKITNSYIFIIFFQISISNKRTLLYIHTLLNITYNSRNICVHLIEKHYPWLKNQFSSEILIIMSLY